MTKWLMVAVLVLLVLAAAMGLKSFSTQSWDGAVITSPTSWTMAPTTAPPPTIPWGP
jgi:hypothetical protein